jgi:Sec-independent protein secretion pathway component TatC
MGLVMAPLVLLYFAGILLARITQPRRTEVTQTSESAA